MRKGKHCSVALPPESSSRLNHEPIAEITAPRDLQLHFITFKNSIFVQIWTLVKLLGYIPDNAKLDKFYPIYLVLANKGNDSEMTFVAGATKINPQKLKTYDLMI